LKHLPDLFNYTYKDQQPSTIGTSHQFDWTFGNQSGHITIKLNSDDVIDQLSLMHCTKNPSEFKHSLRAYNDETMYDVFKMMLKNQNISYK
jgi:hypothetical protein